MTKRVAVIQDLSCIGRCSLGVAMAVLPAMGCETAVLPAAILSAHTAFDGFTFLDFADEAEKIIAHWRALRLRFDLIYIGYLGSLRLIDMTARFLDAFAEDGVGVVLDPAFGDNGRLYAGFDAAYVRAMRRLCVRADVILPNVTELCFLLDMPFGDSPEHSHALAKSSGALLGEKLKNVLITSCRFDGDRTGLICAGQNPFTYAHERLALSSHGTGDLFASVYAGMAARGAGIEAAARMAADFTFDCLKYSMSCPDHRWYGVDFEAMLPELMTRLKQG